MLARLVFLLTLAFARWAAAEPSAFRPLQDWPLGTCSDQPLGARLCLDAPALWNRYGHGAPEVEVAVVETWATHAMPQILSQHPWLSHLDIPTFWHIQRDEDLPRVDGQTLPVAEALSDRQQAHAIFCQDLPDHPTCQGVGDGAHGEAEAALGYLGWQGRANHELKMIGLIAGQDASTLRRTGLAPLGSVSLHYIETTPSPTGLSRMAARLDRRPGVRVVNFSNQGPPDELLDLQYARIFRTALALNAGQTGITGADPGDRLVVASSANTTGTRALRRALPSPNRFVPPEAVVREAEGTAPRVRADAQAAHLLTPPDVPVLVVAGLSAAGQLCAEARIEPMIDLYAPGGMTELQIVRTRGERGTVERAREAFDAIRAMQRCALVARESQSDGVPTLDWGPGDDIRSARMVHDAEARWHRAASTIFAPDLGCASPVTGPEDIYLARAIGNSVSTAIVSAVAAQMFALDPQLSAREARDILRETARANRVNGLPVLDAGAAFQTVLDRYIARHLTGHALSLVPGTITSRSIAPGAFGQTVWRDLRDDPPLRIVFTALTTGPSEACSAYRVALETEVTHSDGKTARRIRSERVGPAPALSVVNSRRLAP